MKTHLQGLGTVKSKAACDFKVGESMLWNYGLEETVVAVEKETAKTITFTVKNASGQLFSRKLNKSRQVGLIAA
ncbi:hypothetical protein ACQKEF_09890 [Pseudomonas oryzihabitans]|uniref:hypothetical protein n=1 Tax=Pseudomonas oryzihabitans TaxID=47885 RepID=UPI003CFDCDE0